MLAKNSIWKDRTEQGRRFERTFFGSVWKGYEDKHPRWMGKAEALADVIARQEEIGWNPHRPRTKLAADVFDCVRSYLPPELKSELHMYCCLGTCLDIHHGCDVVIELRGAIVTIDLSLTEKNKHDLKTDINLSENHLTFQFMWRHCNTIAIKLLERLSKR
jgi:hypothetical protein